MIQKRLQYISSGTTISQQYENVLRALDHGVDWIQLRFKISDIQQVQQLTDQAKALQNRYNFTLIINDHVDLVNEFDLDGVHLGLQDMNIDDARKIIGTNKIIGGTANTYFHVLQRTQEQCDYIGLGPLRYTTTKTNLSPILGFPGYKEILTQADSTPPIFGIGSVSIDDVVKLRKLGVFGVAISREIESRLHEEDYINTLNTLLHEKYT